MFILSRNIFLMLGVVVVYLLITALQLLYPHGQALPFAKVYNYDISLQSEEVLRSKLTSAYARDQFIVKDSKDNSEILFNADELGIEINVDNIMATVASYPFWQRLIPFSIVFPRQFNINPILTIKDYQTLDSSDDKTLPQTQNPEDATILRAETDNILTVKRAKNIITSLPGNYQEIFANFRLKPNENYNTELTLPLTKAAIQTADAEEIAEKINDNILFGWNILFSVDGAAEQTLSSKQILSMLDIKPNPEESTINVSINRTLMTTVLSGLAQKHNIVFAKDTIVHLLNGQEKTRDDGNDGKNVDFDHAFNTFEEALTSYKTKYLASKMPIEIKVSDVKHNVIYETDYTFDLIGLQKLLSDKIGTDDVGVVVIDLKDRSRRISINADKVFETASTYKLFVAYSMFKSKQVFPCLNEMIVHSQNECAWDFLNGSNESGSNPSGFAYGWPKMLEDIHGFGLSGATHTDENGKYSTANDEALFLTKLYDNQLSPPVDKNLLLDLMKTQVFRQGIPAGVGRNGVVADKVGFLDGYLHDASIVYSIKGDYVEVILTNGQSWDVIADIARTVQHYF